MTITILSFLAILLPPGPTNVLLAVAGAQAGLRRGLRLVPVVLAAYLAVVVPLVLWGGHLLQISAGLSNALAAVVAGWVAWLALKLWRLPPVTAEAGGQTMVTPRVLALTTLTNPKALVIGLMIVAWNAPPVLTLGLFVWVLAGVSTLWVALGAGLLARAGRWANRGSALCLAGLSVILALRAVTG